MTICQCNIHPDSSTFALVDTRGRDRKAQVRAGPGELLWIHVGLGPEAALQDDPRVGAVHGPGRKQDMGAGPIDPAPYRL